MVHAKVVHRYVDEFCDADMTQEFAKAVWARYKADGTDLREIPSLAEPHAFVRNLNNELADSVLGEMNDEEDNSDFEGMVTFEEVTSSGLRGMLQEVQHICGKDSETVPLAIVEVVKLAREGVEAKRKNATLSKQNTEMDAKLVKDRVVKRTIREQLVGVKLQVTTLRTQLSGSQLALEKLASEVSRTEADFWAQVFAVEETLNVKRARVERLERDVTAEAEKRQLLLLERRETSETASCQLTKNGESFQKL